MPLPALSLRPELFDADAVPEVVAVPVRPGDDGPVLGAGGEQAASRLGVDLVAELARVKSKGEVGEVHELPVRSGAARPVGEGGAGEGTTAPARTEAVLLVGVGDGSPLALRRAGAALARRCRGRATVATTLAVPAGADGVGPDAAVRALAEGLLLGSYSFTRRREPKGPPAVEQAVIVTAQAAERAPTLARAVAVGEAVWRARDLANAPSNEKDPAWLAAQAEELAAAAGLQVRIRDETELAAEGFEGILAVGQGSVRPPRLIELTYTPAGSGGDAAPQPADAPRPHVVLVGKGITFDSGGLSLKPREAMVPMKTDMAAGGAVIAAMGALGALGVQARVTALVPAAENLPSGTAQRPGDVITHYGGTTVEVLNTDAEGRLVLADALAYAVHRLAPDVLVDLATLTGAASLGLGRRHGALYTGDNALAAELTAAGADSGDRVWRMPLVEDYRAELDSPVADLCHIAVTSRSHGGSITAALFLREFTRSNSPDGAPRWAHLDIAGPARADADEHEVTKGGTGFGTRLLLRWLEQLG